MDNLKVHHANKVSEWVEKHKDRIELFYLPPYAPEHNPDELLNSDVKRNAGAKTSPRSQKKLESNVRSRLKKLQNNPAIVDSLFSSSPYEERLLIQDLFSRDNEQAFA